MPAMQHFDDDVRRFQDEPDEPEGEESQPQRVLRTLVGGRCSDCRVPYSAREAVYSIFLGLTNAPRCLACIGCRLGRLPDELREELLAYFETRECYLQAYREAERLDEAGETVEANTAPRPQVEPKRAPGEAEPAVDSEWDAGDMGCGELVMALRLRLGAMTPGAVLRVTATDPAAPEDLPAWCRLCGHPLVAMDHPHYWIRRKGV